jgi:hypothetical protein
MMLAVRTDFAEEFLSVSVQGIEGTIIPAKTAMGWHENIRQGRGAPHGIQDMLGTNAESFWTPTQKDIAVVESRLRTVLEETVKDPSTLVSNAKTPDSKKYLSEQISNILKHYGEYRRQYVGLVVNGRRRIYLNSFPSREKGASYTTQFVTVFDGGFWFWRVVYQLDDATFLDLSINGEA